MSMQGLSQRVARSYNGTGIEFLVSLQCQDLLVSFFLKLTLHRSHVHKSNTSFKPNQIKFYLQQPLTNYILFSGVYSLIYSETFKVLFKTIQYIIGSCF